MRLCNTWRLAVGLLAEMVESTVQQCTIVFNSAICAWKKTGNQHQQVGVSANMAESTVQQDNVMCTAANSASEVVQHVAAGSVRHLFPFYSRVADGGVEFAKLHIGHMLGNVPCGA